jgi:VanZ family protein
MAPVGALLVLLWVERGGRARTAAVGATIGSAIAFAVVEAMRGLSGGDLAPWAVVVRTLAVGVAASLTAARFRRGSGAVAWVRGVAARVGPIAFTALLLLWSWRPLVPVGSGAELVAKLGRYAFVPMAALAETFTLHSAIDVAVSFLLYVPVGAWLAARSPKAGEATGVRALWPGVLLAFVSEGGQLFVATRTLDVTDALVQAAGVLVGWAIVRQAFALQRLRTEGIASKARTMPGAGLRQGNRDAPGVLLR